LRDEILDELLVVTDLTLHAPPHTPVRISKDLLGGGGCQFRGGSVLTLLIPMLLSCSSSNCQLGSTFSELKPFSLSNPMWATCLNPEGAPIMDLSMPPFFFLEDVLPFAAFLADAESM
jgi:hypothetical protein